MNRNPASGLGAFAVVALLLIGCQSTSSPSPSVEPSPSAEPSTAEPSSPAAALTETFTSERHGFSISYPAGWVTRPATEPWTSGFPDFYAPAGDVIHHPTLEDHLWIMVASQPLAGMSAEEWVDDTLTGLISQNDCVSTREAVVVDGAQGEMCGSSAVAVSSGDRGYLIWLYVSPDDPADAATYDRAWIDEVLATVQLEPEDAVALAQSTSR